MKRTLHITYYRLCFSLLFLFSVSVSFSVYSATPGVTPGEFSVGADGSANYTIPLAVPPGTSGMQPSLSLSYHHRSGNGLLGVGWTLGGLSVITRCPTTRVIDGLIDGVDFDKSDRFCLDGQRLIQVAGDNNDYGADGNEYRTEVDGFTKIIAYGDVGDGTTNKQKGPEKFIAWTKSGQVLEYGYTADSRIEAEGRTDVRLWAVNKVSDTVGNYMTVTYQEDSTNGSYWPTQIDYTGNDNPNANITPNTRVTFEYETRADAPPLYFAGSKIQNTQRLTNIKTYTDTVTTPILVRDYQLTYDNNGAANRSRLTQVQECDGQSTPNCFRPTKFEWIDEQVNQWTITDSTDNYGGVNSNHAWLSGDLNGDGLTDLIRRSNSIGGSAVFIADGNGQWTITDSTDNYGGVNNNHAWLSGDLNGDGLTDLIRRSNSVGGSAVFIADGNGQWTITDSTDNYGGVNNNHAWLSGDLNGDGLTDLIRRSNSVGGSAVFIADGNGQWTITDSTDNYGGVNSNHAWLSGDLNGDGLTDLIRRSNSVGGSAVFIADGNGQWTITDSTDNYGGVNNDHAWLSGDLNGDGLTDLIRRSNSVGGSAVFIADGNGQWTITDSTDNYGGVNNNHAWLSGDLNGDGLTDLIRRSNSVGGSAVFIADGNGQWTITDSTDNYGGVNNNHAWLSGDLNGDGLTDLIRRAHSISSSAVFTNLSTANSAKIHRIANSLNTTTTLSYLPITNDDVYTKGSGAVYPVVDVQAPVYVVSSASVDDGLGGQRVTNYTYAGARSSLDGRGFLGFNAMTAVDSSTGITTTTTYHQTHPYIGLVKRTEQYWDNDTSTDTTDDVLLGEVDTTFAQTQTHTGIEVDSSHPGVLFPYARTVTKKDYELN